MKQSEVLQHFFCLKVFGMLGRKGGRGLTKSKSFEALFSYLLGELGTTIVPQKFQKLGLLKKCLKSSNILGGRGGGSDRFWKKPNFKLHFLGLFITPQNVSLLASIFFLGHVC